MDGDKGFGELPGQGRRELPTVNRIVSAAMMSILTLLAGCGDPSAGFQPGPAVPNLAIYSGGVFLESTDGLRSYDDILIFPGSLRGEVAIQLPDGASIDAKAFSPGILKEHGVAFEIKRDDGRGGFELVAAGPMQASFRDQRCERIHIYSDYALPENFAVVFKGQRIQVPISRDALELLVGRPDQTKMDTFPLDR